MNFFRLYDWNKDGVITEPDIDSIINENDHNLSEGIYKEVMLYTLYVISSLQKVLLKKKASSKDLKKKIYLSLPTFNRITNGHSAFYNLFRANTFAGTLVF